MILFRLACLLLLWGTVQAHASVVSPLGGYCRVGRFLPLKTDAPLIAFRFDFPGAVPVSGQSLQPGAVVPILILEPPRSNLPNLTFKTLEPDQRLVAFTGEPNLQFARDFCKEEQTLAIHIDSLEGPAIAYNALDALVLDHPLPSTLNIQALWIAGVSIGVQGADKPDAILPWTQTPWGWRLDAHWAGPNRAGDNPMALACVQGWTPTYPDSHRTKIALLGAIASMVLLGAARVPGRYKFPAILLCGAALSIGFILWGRQVDPVITQSATIQTSRGQCDQWRFYGAVKPAEFTIPWSPNMLPLGAVASLSLECDSSGAPIQWKAALKPNQKLGVVSRTFAKDSIPPAGENLPQSTRLSMLVRRSYLITGDWKPPRYIPAENANDWGTVLLEKAE